MTDDREREILRHIRSLTSLEEARGFREQLTAQDEMTGAVMVALKQRMDRIEGDVP
jgi:hypothetical protein